MGGCRIGKPLGTGGSIRKAERHLRNNGPFLVLNGDVFSELDYSKMLEAHEEKCAVATIALHQVSNPSRYGVAELTNESRIVRFVEKPPSIAGSTNLANAGIYIFSTEILSYIPKGREVSLEHEVFPQLSQDGKLYGYVFDSFWTDIGKLEDYVNINKVLLANFNSNQKYKIESKFQVKKPVAFDEGVSIGNKSIVGPYTILGRNTVIGKNVQIMNSIVLPRTVIGDFSVINGALIGENVMIQRNVNIDEGCVIGDHVRIERNVSLAKGVSICPAKEVTKRGLTTKRVT